MKINITRLLLRLATTVWLTSLLAFGACGDYHPNKSAAEGLDLKTLPGVVKQAKDAKHLEKLINQPGGVNNLDLNDDGKVDYIRVVEYGDKEKGAYGFSLTTQPVEGETQEVAAIEIQKDPEKKKTAELEVRGNEQIYGRNHYYHARFPVAQLLLWSYLLRPHAFYASPFHYGHYPGYYRSYNVAASGTYSQRTRQYRQAANVRKNSSSRMRTDIKSPHRGKTASRGIKRSLRRPTQSQRTFQRRNPARSRRGRSFGRSGSRNRSFFGRSSRSRSRSFGFGK